MIPHLPGSILLFAFLLPLWQAAAAGAERWIVVSATGLETAAQPLVEHRREEGFAVESLSLSAVPGDSPSDRCAALRQLLRERVDADSETAYVLLLGATAGTERDFVIPAFAGTFGRMRGEPTDHPYASDSSTAPPRFALGRLPARSVNEAQAMIAKLLRFEEDSGPWQDQLTLIVGNPGGRSALERQFAEMFLQSVGTQRLQQLHPRWRIQALFHSQSSPFGVPDERLADRCREYLSDGQLWAMYLGHSGPQGLWSDTVFLHRDDWSTLRIQQGAGVLFTCGCYGCQLDETPGGAGYGLAAIRNPQGPVAVIGAHGESYAAIGQLAFDGMSRLLARAEPPERLGDYWHAVQRSIATQTMNPLMFYLYDQADGSGGRTPLADQRREHLEMWMLLGDPALKLPLAPLTISLEAQPEGDQVMVTGQVPARFAHTTVTLTLERPAGSEAARLESLGPQATERSEQLDRNHRRANQFVLATERANCNGPTFSSRLAVPANARWTELVVRARCASSDQTALGIAEVQLPAAQRQR